MIEAFKNTVSLKNSTIPIMGSIFIKNIEDLNYKHLLRSEYRLKCECIESSSSNFITYDLEDNLFIKINDLHLDPRPFCFISLGGTTNGSTLVGHNITYHGATSGDIVKNLKGVVDKCK